MAEPLQLAPSFRAFLLDFDGLICDTERAAYLSWVDLYARHGLEFSDNTWLRMAGRADGALVAVQDLTARLGQPLREEDVAWRLERKHQLANVEPLKEGVTELLAAIAARGLPRLIVSSGDADWIEHHLDRLGVAGAFTGIICHSHDLRAKPAPDLYHAAVNHLSLSPQEMVAFEDSACGIAAAKSAGLWSVGVPNAVGNTNDLVGADVVVTSLAAIRLAEWHAQ